MGHESHSTEKGICKNFSSSNWIFFLCAFTQWSYFSGYDMADEISATNRVVLMHQNIESVQMSCNQQSLFC